MIWLKRIAAIFAIAFLVLSFTNASWIAPNPSGAPKQIAHRAVGPELLGLTSYFDSGCKGAAISQPYHRHAPNTIPAILRADRLGAWHVEVDPQLTSDGEVVLLGSGNLGCLTEASGSTENATLEQIRALDPGYGYRFEAEGGVQFPLRGTGLTIPTLGEAARTIPRQARLMVDLGEDNEALVDAVATALDTINRDPVAKGDGFYGSPEQIDRIRARYPGVWAIVPEQARQCTADYRLTGWTGIVPSSCEQGTMLIGIEDQGFLWGWPNRLIARMAGPGVEIIMEGPDDGRALPDHDVRGITLPEQLTKVPASFNGFIWTDDAFTTVPALVQRYDNRTQEEIDASEAALQNRRAAQ